MRSFALSALFLWVLVATQTMRVLCVCDHHDTQSGARCAAGNIPHSHVADRLLLATLIITSPLHPVPAIAIAAIAELWYTSSFSIKGHTFFFNR